MTVQRLKKYPNAQMKTLVGKKTVAYNQNGEYFVNPLNKKIQKYEISILKEIAKKNMMLTVLF